MLRQARGGRRRLKRGCCEEKITGFIRLTAYLSYKASSNTDTPSYSSLITAKTLTPATVKKLAPTNVLLDTGASVSLLQFWQAQQLGVEVKKKDSIHVRGANGKLLAIAGIGHIYARDKDCTFWKRLTLVVSMEGNHALVSLKDQKCLFLIENQYPKFLG